MSRKIYILQKDLPNASKGAAFEENDFGNYNCMGLQNLMYDRNVVETKTDWFQLKIEKRWTDYDMQEIISFYRINMGKYLEKAHSAKQIFEDFAKSL